MMRGIDVSSHQGNINIGNLKGVQFVIAKATQGDYYVNPYCDGVVQQCIDKRIPWGFYHFADDRQDAKTSADYFIENCENYFGEGIPCLDWEELYEQSVLVSDPDVTWVNDFVERVHDRTGVWPWIYANPWRFNQGGVNENCGRWIAQYPNVTRPGLDYSLPEVPKTDGLACCWQYASDGRVEGYANDLDVNAFFGDEKAWMAYAKGDRKQEEANPNIDTLENSEYIVTIERKG